MDVKFPVGMVNNPLKRKIGVVSACLSEVRIKYPSRLNAMALDPSRIDISGTGVYTPGEIVFAVDIYKDVRVSLCQGEDIQITVRTPRKPLVKHAALLMRSVLGKTDGWEIDIDAVDIRHAGLGSSSGLIASVAAAINELYGRPISNRDLIAYLAQNHGEEIDGNEGYLQHVQCIGGAAAAGLLPGGMKILSGESVPIASMDIDYAYTVLIGIPEDFTAPDAHTLMAVELSQIDKFIATGNAYRDTIGYRVVHETLPAMALGNLKTASQLIFDYRFDYGSIVNCSFTYPKMIDIARDIRHLYEEGYVETLALSSVGPAFFAITLEPSQCEQVFAQNNMKVIKAHIANEGYKVISCERI